MLGIMNSLSWKTAVLCKNVAKTIFLIGGIFKENFKC